MKTNWLTGKTVVVTGASSGFGKIICQRLIKQFNCNVIGIARNVERLEALKTELGENFDYRSFDVGVEQNWQNFCEELTSQGKTVDVLINNAGILPPFEKFKTQNTADVKKVMDTNFFSQVYACGHMLPIIKQSKSPAIINVSSSAALATVAGTAAYSSSKSALKSFTEALIAENPNMYVALVCPGFAKTGIFRSQPQMNEREKKLIDKICSDPEKMVSALIKKIVRRKKRIVIGADARAMDFFYRLKPLLTNSMIAKVLKKFKLNIFEKVFEDK